MTPEINIPSQLTTLTWLHLSDLHVCKPKTGWDAKRVTDALCKDLKKMQRDRGLRPDLIFFTGDAAYGQMGNSEGKSITEQFRDAHDFFTAVRESFQPEIEQRNFFIVPGNHDVNRNRITDFETEWLLSKQRSLDEINRCIQDTGANWKKLLERLDDYAHFLQTYGYDHLLTGRDRLIYADAREFNGLRVGIAGFNSAWSSRGVGREEAGRLWMAGRFQLETLNGQMPPCDLKIALLHHPSNWLFPEENTTFGRQLERDFTFVLHGHEHQDFVKSDAGNGHTVISAGACHEWSESKNNGYNFVRLDFAAGTGEVWLRQYDSMGGGWIPRIIHDRTDDRGCWNLTHLQPWMQKLMDVKNPKKNNELQEEDSNEIIANSKIDRVEDYEARYLQSVAKKLDYVELFGIDLPRESKEYSLTVAYVSLNLSDEDATETEVEELEDDLTLTNQTTFPAEQVFDNLADKGRLLIRGIAGSGKTTILRWAAVQSARNQATATHAAKQKLLTIKPLLSGNEEEIDAAFADPARDWRHKIPFIIRLRNCIDGQLPRPCEFHLLLAKELPDPPAGWIDEVLSSGRALVMFDGVDEVPLRLRDATMREIRELIDAYADNYYVVTTRPEAVERYEFIERGFVSARVEPMAPSERDEFIDRWHQAMEVRLQNKNEPTDLRPLARRLKQRLESTSAVARLTSNPLLCAVVCALHRLRNENLPETPVDLCEKLCEMLLDRRDKERLNVEAQKWIDEAYGKLEFRVRKGVLSQLAYYMVNSGLSAIPEAEADEQIKKALESYKITNVKADAIRRALIERSGMLQESSDRTIEFLHNTLKEFLAAERFFNVGDVRVLADRADDPSWQPAILFTLALPRDGSSFATDLIRAILEKTSLDALPIAQSKEAKLQNAKIRAKQFFLLRCYTNAYQINDSKIRAVFDLLSKQLLPPRNMTDAVALASCGEAIVPYLEYKPQLKAIERAACVRTLGLIGDARANSILKDYLNDPALAVAQELASFVNDWSQISAIKQHVEYNADIPIRIPRRCLQDLSQITNFTNLTSLYLGGTKVNDISVLVNFPKLTYLYIGRTQVSDLAPLANLNSLTYLNLEETQVSDLAPLANLTNLKTLHIERTQVRDLAPLANLTNLTSLCFGRTQVSDLAPLANLTSLTNLYLWETQVSDIVPLANLTNLTSLSLTRMRVNDISMLTNLTNISALANLTNLTSLCLGRTQVSDLASLANLTSLTNLYLWETQVSDIAPLANLTNLKTLNIERTQVNDIAPLANLTSLTNLFLRGTQVSNLAPLASLTSLQIHQ